jgi:HK97 family phage major capsid protein
MKSLIQLRQHKAELTDSLKSLLTQAQSESRSLSETENTKFSAIKNEVENLNGQIEQSEFLADEERSLINTSQAISNDGMPNNAEMRTFCQTGDIRSLSAGVNADGGYSVVPALDNVIDKLLKESSVFRQNATVKTISTEKYEKLVSVGGTSAEWADESDARGETTTSQLEKVTIPTHSLYCYPKTTQELMDWSDFDVAGWLSSEIADETGLKEEAAFWNGDAVKKPKGLMTYPVAATADSVRAFGTIQEIDTAGVGVIATDDLITLSHTLRNAYRPGAKFFMNDSTQEGLRKLKTTDGDYIWRMGITDGQSSMLLGKAIETAEELADGVIVYGDLAKAYTVVDHTSGTRMIRDNITAIGWIKMLSSRYCGGGLIDSNAVKFLKVAV